MWFRSKQDGTIDTVNMPQIRKYKWIAIVCLPVIVVLYIFYPSGPINHSYAINQIARSQLNSTGRYIDWKYINGFPRGNDEYIVIASARHEILSCLEQKDLILGYKDLFPSEFRDFNPIFQSSKCDSHHYVWYKNGLAGALKGDRTVELIGFVQGPSPPIDEQCLFRKSEQGWILQGCRQS